LILPLFASPWLVGIAVLLVRGPRLEDPPESYFKSAERRLSVR
jgi:hypothetical protein